MQNRYSELRRKLKQDWQSIKYSIIVPIKLACLGLYRYTFLQMCLPSLSFLDLLDVVILNPLEMVAEAAANVLVIAKGILSSFTEMFKGVEGT